MTSVFGANAVTYSEGLTESHLASPGISRSFSKSELRSPFLQANSIFQLPLKYRKSINSEIERSIKIDGFIQFKSHKDQELGKVKEIKKIRVEKYKKVEELKRIRV